MNLLLRGGTAMLLVLVAAVLWRDHRGRLDARLGAAFAIGIAAATLSSVPAVMPNALIAGLASGAMFVFWLFTCALFDDGFRLRAWHGLAWAGLAAVGIASCFSSPPGRAIALWLGTMPLLWSVMTIAKSLASWREDLVEGRRRLRSLTVTTTALYTLGQGLAALALGLPLKTVIDSSANAAGTAALTGWIAWRLLRVNDQALFAPAAAAVASPTAPVETADPRQLAALDTLMASERIYREPQLTIGSLAERMRLPERQLRRLINQGLGHRNFNAFLNAHRLADAQRWLADPAQPDTPILTIAMDAGFQSIGPFNRAFKAATGMTPSEFRRASMAESGTGQS